MCFIAIFTNVIISFSLSWSLQHLFYKMHICCLSGAYMFVFVIANIFVLFVTSKPYLIFLLKKYNENVLIWRWCKGWRFFFTISNMSGWLTLFEVNHCSVNNFHVTENKGAMLPRKKYLDFIIRIHQKVIVSYYKVTCLGYDRNIHKNSLPFTTMQFPFTKLSYL